MSNQEITGLTLRELSAALSAKKLSSIEITGGYLKAIEDDLGHEKPVHPYINVFAEQALAAAKTADKIIASGSHTPLTGIPIAIKDNMNIKGFPTTCASKILEGYTAAYSAAVIDSLITEKGMVVLGKTNMDEFAMGSSTETSHFGITRNPWDRDRIPGGSSGGSAAAVAGFLAPAALGSDTGGSIRQPACLCGVVGMKPTYGLVSRYGLVAFASSLDQIGPITRSVEDCALLLGSLTGHDERDSTSLDIPAKDYKIKPDVKGLRIGIPQEYFIEGMDPEVRKNVEDTCGRLEKLGAKIVDISLPHSDYAVPAYYIVATAEASSNLERFDGVKYGLRAEASNLSELYIKTRSEGFGDEVKRRIMLGTYVLSAGYYDAYYMKALKVRTLIRQDFDRAFEKADYILGPTSPTPAFKIGEKMDDPIAMYLSDIYTISLNLAGLPGISVPSGKTKSGLPLGLQVAGKLLDEGGVMNVASAIESLSGSKGDQK
jgi:aspartyl-tRNA(Asn)/glutamyl-tRNA(Gln) amidotransferase subunit A